MKLQLKPLPVWSLCALTALATGCLATAETTDDGAEEDDMTAPGDGDGNTTAPGDGDTTIGDGGAAGDGDLFGGTCPVQPCPGDGDTDSEPLPIEVYLPVVVSDIFAPSGFMGQINEPTNGPNETEGIVMDETGCTPEDRPDGAVGECFAVTYEPQYLTPCTAAQLEADPGCEGSTWAGAYFQNPSLNWGESPGVVIEPGATKVVFTAWTPEGQLDLKFIAGGIGEPQSAYSDSFKVEQSYTINSTPTQYSLNIAGAPYEMVIGGFAWTVEVEGSAQVSFFLDDIRWVAE